MATFTIEELVNAFDHLDENKSGTLCRNEVADLLRNLNIEPTKLELNMIFTEIDTDNSIAVSKKEFIDYMNSPVRSRVTLEELKRQFRVFDEDDDGAITYEELRDMIGQVSSLEDIQRLKDVFNAADRNENGRITLEEFVRIMKE